MSVLIPARPTTAPLLWTEFESATLEWFSSWRFWIVRARWRVGGLLRTDDSVRLSHV